MYFFYSRYQDPTHTLKEFFNIKCKCLNIKNYEIDGLTYKNGRLSKGSFFDASGSSSDEGIGNLYSLGFFPSILTHDMIEKSRKVQKRKLGHGQPSKKEMKIVVLKRFVIKKVMDF